MKLLLAAVNAKYIHSNPAVYSLRAYAGQYDSNVEIAEYTINHREDFIIGDIYRTQPDILAFSCYIWNISLILSIAQEMKKILPDTLIWLGGPEVSYHLSDGPVCAACIDGIMAGEGEATFLELLEYYVDGKGSLEQIRGIVWKRKPGGEVVVNPPRPPMNLSRIPFSYDRMTHMEHRIIYYETSRGCPYRCSYCLSSNDREVRFRDLGMVKRELSYFLDQRVAQVKFVDRTFNCSREHAGAIWSFLKEHDNEFTNFHFEIAADILGEEELELLSSLRPGLVQLEIGVQSINPDTLRAIRRTTDLEKLSYAVGRIRKAGNIHQHLDLIAGLPYEDLASFRRSFDYVYRLKPDQIQLGFLKVLRGAFMEECCKEYGIVCRNAPPYEVLSTRWISYGELLELKQVEEMVEVYYNSGQFEKTMEYLEHFTSSPYELYRELGSFYDKHGLNERKHARIDRYEILLSFAEERFGSQAETMGQLLTYDLYLRENMKSRPAFAEDLKEYKETIRLLFEKEEKIKELLPGYEAYSRGQIGRMTHVEHFNIEIEETARTGKPRKKESFLLFDYLNQDVLFKRARVICPEE